MSTPAVPPLSRFAGPVSSIQFCAHSRSTADGAAGDDIHQSACVTLDLFDRLVAISAIVADEIAERRSDAAELLASNGTSLAVRCAMQRSSVGFAGAVPGERGGAPVVLRRDGYFDRACALMWRASPSMIELQRAIPNS